MDYLGHILTASAFSNGTYENPLMHRDLVGDSHGIGWLCAAPLIRENGLVARQKRLFKRTTDSEHAWSVAPTLFS